MKKNILAIVLSAAVMLAASVSYAATNNSSATEKSYTVHSVINGRQSTTFYDKKGHWLYTIQRYSLDNLDKNIVDQVHNVYSNYGVTAIQKIEGPAADPVYVINLENKTSIKVVKLANGEVQLLKDLTKG